MQIHNSREKYQDISRNIKIYLDISRYIQTYQDISRNIKKYVEISRYIQKYQDICRNFKIYLEISRYLQKQQEICRNIKINLEISRYLLKYQDISRNIKIYVEISAEYIKIFRGNNQIYLEISAEYIQKVYFQKYQPNIVRNISEISRKTFRNLSRIASVNINQNYLNISIYIYDVHRSYSMKIFLKRKILKMLKF